MTGSIGRTGAGREAHPLVSVVIPTYNQAAYLGEAVDSVLAQSYRPIECIVVDDGSTDATPDVLASYGDRITVIRQANRGAAAALNVGIAAAAGDLVCWLSSDDAFLPPKVERQVAALADAPEIALCCTGWEVIDAAGTVLRRFDAPPWVHDDRLVSIFWDNPINGTTVMLPRRTIELVGAFDESLRADVDGDMWLRIAARGRIIVVPEVLAKYRVHAGAMSRDTRLMTAAKTKVRLARLRDGSLRTRLRASDGDRAAATLATIGEYMVGRGLIRLAWALLGSSVRAGLAPTEQLRLMRAVIRARADELGIHAPDLRKLRRSTRAAASRIPLARAAWRAFRRR